MHSTINYKLAFVPWLVLGAAVGWSASVCLWQAGHLRAPDEEPDMVFIVVACTVLVAAFHARKHTEVLPRLIAYTFLFSGVVWPLAPSVSGKGLEFFREVRVINEWFPCVVIPAGILGGIIAVAFTRLKGKTDG